MEKGKNGEKFKCKTFGSWWLWGGQQANYHTRPPIQLSLIVRPHADCKNKQGSWIVVKFWESFSLDCLFCSFLLLRICLFSQVASVVSKYFAESPFHPWLRVPPLPPRRWLCRKVVLTFPYLIFSHLVIFFWHSLHTLYSTIKKIIHCNWRFCILPQWLYCKVVLILPLLTYHIRSKNCCKCISHQ